MRQVLPVVGAVVGAYIGSFFGATAQGAQIGWAIGSVIGNAVDPLVIKGPSIGDIASQTSQEGVPRPIFFALSQPVSGNIVACSDPKIIKHRQRQGKGGPVTETQTVTRTYAIAIGEGPVTSLVRCWSNGKLVYDERPGGDPSGNALFFQNGQFFFGTFDQMPSSSLEAVFGVGKVPAMRGTCYIAWHDIDLTNQAGAVPQYVFQVLRCEGLMLTSRPYALESLEGVETTPGLVRGNSFSQPEDYVSAAASIVSGDLRPVVVPYSHPAEDAVQTSAALIEGDIHQIVRTYAHPAEDAVETAAALVEGDIKQIVITYLPIAEDAVETAAALVSGTLV